MVKNSEYLKEFIDGVIEKELNVLGIVVRQHGEVVAAHEFVPQERIQLFSASKTFTAIAVGLAIDDGLLNIDDRFVDLLADELPDTLPGGFERLTLWHLLTMSTGHDECPIFKMQRKRMEEMQARGETPPMPGDRPAAERDTHMSDNWFSAFITEPLTKETGKFYAYNNGASYMLSIIVQKKVGMPIVDYLRPRLFDPLGIENVEWDMDSKGRNLGAIGLHLNTEELSLAGQLLMNNGVWNGKQLIPADYVRQMTTKQVDNEGPDKENSAGYGYQVWMCSYPKAYRLDGMFGQFSIGLPTLDAVVTITSHKAGIANPIIHHVWDTITPRLEKTK